MSSSPKAFVLVALLLGVLVSGAPCVGAPAAAPASPDVAVASAFYQTPPQAPADLLLTDSERNAADALGHFAWGLFLQLRGTDKPDTFLEHYRQALILTPDSDVVLKYLVTPWLFERNFDKIIEALGPIAEAHPEVARVQLVLTQALLARDKVDESIKILERAIERGDWGEPLLVRELSVCYWKAKRYGDVKRLLKRARRRFKKQGRFTVEHAAAVFYGSLMHLAPDEQDEYSPEKLERLALNHARRALEEKEQASRAADIESLAGILAELEAWEDLIVLLRFAQTKRHWMTPELDLLLVQALNAEEREDETVEILERVMKAASVQPHLYLRIGRHYLAAERLDRAADFFELAAVAFPNVPECYLRLGYIYLRQGRDERAIEMLEKMPELPPEGYLLKSHAYRNLDRLQETAKALATAEELARKAKREAFFTIDFYLFYAAVCEDLGYTDRGLDKVKQALELDPDDAASANFLGYVMADHNRDLPAAETWVLKALAAEPENYAYLDSIAWVYFRQKRYGEALVQINDALRLSTREPDPIILDHAGDIYAANGLWVMARTYWNAALAAGPRDVDIPQIRRKITDSRRPAGK